MTADAAAPTARIRDLDDLLGIIPHLVGFHPEESLVALVVQEGRVVLTARADLAGLVEHGNTEDLVDQLVAQFPGAGLLLTAYSQRESRAWRVLERCRDHLGEAVIELVCVSRGRWRSGDRNAPRHRHDPRSSRAAAEAAWHGLQARPRRADVAALLRAVDTDEERCALWMDALAELEQCDDQALSDRMDEVLDRALADPAGATRADCARLGVLAVYPLARDRALLRLEKGTASRCLALWLRVVRQCPDDLDAQPLGLVGMAAWLAGEGALQTICLQRLDQRRVRTGLYNLLNNFNVNMVDPRRWEEIRAAEEDFQSSPPTSDPAA